MSCPTGKTPKICEQNGVSALPIESPCYRSPGDFGKALHRFLYGRQAFSLLDVGWLECGWLDGGCRILGNAILLWLGPEHVQLRQLGNDRSPVDHVVAQVGLFYLDGDGVSTEKKLLRRWEKEELIRSPRLYPYNEQELDEGGIPRDGEISAKLAEMLRKKFDAETVIRLLDPLIR